MKQTIELSQAEIVQAISAYMRTEHGLKIDDESVFFDTVADSPDSSQDSISAHAKVLRDDP